MDDWWNNTYKVKPNYSDKAYIGKIFPPQNTSGLAWDWTLTSEATVCWLNASRRCLLLQSCLWLP